MVKNTQESCINILGKQSTTEETQNTEVWVTDQQRVLSLSL
jgi:hypothetical protein